MLDGNTSALAPNAESNIDRTKISFLTILVFIVIVVQSCKMHTQEKHRKTCPLLFECKIRHSAAFFRGTNPSFSRIFSAKRCFQHFFSNKVSIKNINFVDKISNLTMTIMTNSVSERMMTKKLTLLLSWVMMATLAAGQSFRLRTEHYTTRNGLASNVVNTAMQDSKGYIWLGTNQGLTRFDGYQFVNFYHLQDSVRRMENVTLIMEDAAKKCLLMLGSDGQTLCFSLEQMKFINADGLKMPADPKEKTEQSLMQRIQALGVQTLNMTNRHRSVDYVKLDNGLEIYTTIDNGLFIYDPANQQLHHYSATDEHPIIHSNNLNSVLKDGTGSVWITTTYAGIYQLKFDENKMVEHQLTDSPTSFHANNIRSFSPLPSGEVAISNMEGDVYRCDLKKGQTTLMLHKNHRVYTTLTDPKERFWVGTRGGGLWMDDRNLNDRLD